MQSNIKKNSESDSVKLNSSEADALVRFISRAHGIHTNEAFENWCSSELRQFLEFGALVYAMGRLFGEMIVLDELQGVDCPPDLIKQVARRINLKERWVIRRWLKTREPQIIDSSDNERMSLLERREFEEFRLGQVAAHGCIAPDGLQASYFSFFRFPHGLPHNIEAKLRMAVPYLHQVRAQITWRTLTASEGAHPTSRLSPNVEAVLERQRMLANVAQGLSASGYEGRTRHSSSPTKVCRPVGCCNMSQVTGPSSGILFSTR